MLIKDAQYDLNTIIDENGEKVRIYSGFKDKQGNVIEDVFINRPIYPLASRQAPRNHLLKGPVYLDKDDHILKEMTDEELSKELFDSLVKKDFSEEGFYKGEGTLGDWTSFYRLDYVRSGSKKVGSKISLVIQDVYENIIPTGAQEPIITDLVEENYLKTFTEKLEKADELSKQSEVDLELSAILLSQLARQATKEDLVIFDEFL
ncbi:MAG: hypothetical protein BAJALOKI2v1_70092 [Promethearchaeota archaeon]|nr:MAG: hypothetical protein BAJALOKI2v1_70092 [Candidatus Lokiarchaeota archaeon]